MHLLKVTLSYNRCSLLVSIYQFLRCYKQLVHCINRLLTDHYHMILENSVSAWIQISMLYSSQWHAWHLFFTGLLVEPSLQGKVFFLNINKCKIKCKTNLTLPNQYIKNAKKKSLQKRLKQITGREPPRHSLISSFYVHILPPGMPPFCKVLIKRWHCGNNTSVV